MPEKKQDGPALLAAAIGNAPRAVEKFAKAVGVSRTTVYNWLDGTNVPSRHHAKVIAAKTKDAVPTIVWG